MHWSSMGHPPRCTGTRGPNGCRGRQHNPTAHPETQQRLTLEGDRGEDELTVMQSRRGRACGAMQERCHPCETRSYIKYSLRQSARAGSAPGLPTLRCALSLAGPPGHSSVPGKVWVHAPSTLNTLYKATVENPQQRNYKLGEVKTNCCMQRYHLWGMRVKLYANISCFFQGSAKLAELEPVLIFFYLFF